jgi:hypothetical protein
MVFVILLGGIAKFKFIVAQGELEGRQGYAYCRNTSFVVYWCHLVAGAIRSLQDILLLIGGIISVVGGILMMFFTWFAPLLFNIVASFLVIMWGIIAAVAYWL